MPQQSPQHRIGDAARLSGVSAANIRYYEKEGLLRPGVRGDNSYRFYSSADLHRLRFIRLCRAMDMSLDEVRRLLAIDAASDQADHQACATLDEHLALRYPTALYFFFSPDNPQLAETVRRGLEVALADGSFLPESGIKRSEVAAIIVRMFDSAERKSFSLG